MHREDPHGLSRQTPNGVAALLDSDDQPDRVARFLSAPDDIGLLAVGFSCGQSKPGVDIGPKAILESGLLQKLQDDLQFRVHYSGNVDYYHDLLPEYDPDYRGMKNPQATSQVTQKISSQVYSHAREGRFALTLGGDHSIAIGTVSGTARAVRERLGRDMAVIWVDAHADINTPETSASGNIHGMPLAYLTGLASDKEPHPFAWLSGPEHAPQQQPTISLQKLVYIGLRDVDRAEKRVLRERGVRAFSMHDIDRHGIGRVMDMALGWVGRDTPVHLSFDIDALDPMWAPSTGTAVRRGLTLREGCFIAECVQQTGSMVAMDLVEVNPTLEQQGAADTISAGASIIRCALGETLL